MVSGRARARRLRLLLLVLLHWSLLACGRGWLGRPAAMDLSVSQQERRMDRMGL